MSDKPLAAKKPGPKQPQQQPERGKEAAMSEAQTPLVLRRQEAARMLSVSLTTIDRAISRGDLVAKKYGTRTLVPRVEIERYLEKMAQKKAPAA
jgi:excisionase family DNA binding protein